ncbi:cysteine hydrolase family protein [Paenibacillus xanthanilyticus]|uniref:Cysteine hydrolase family protein n=1 Tax=Paenibacillus xanthanilyticus TaxID=1783531 RepID=A0ABV8K3B9_9BACL
MRNRALLVMNLQRDYIGQDARMPVDSGQMPGLLEHVNSLVDDFAQEGSDILYIMNEFSPYDIIGNAFRQQAAVAGSPGAELDARVRIASGLRFAKRQGDAFSNPALAGYLAASGVSELVIAGVFAEGCVARTATAALRLGFLVTIPRRAVGGRNERQRDRAMKKLRRIGVAVSDQLA